MRTIQRTSAFRKDYKREAKGVYRLVLDDELGKLFLPLASDILLPPRYQDHALTGAWTSYRECHIRPDLLLIYCKPDNETLRLVRLGSHGELFGM